ncbi:MAG: hypothetical protein JOY90_18330 [Bradyrhizobium sp.]|uniref:hypothetical protein n=1 Tax=Bradyrhizobium sp. TaxID=376 RepID=UPI001D88D90A|nr:hypothetical protein [Bradyrhizobium sp.]MBV9562379.1 hypothetical protein [Bradyrhizobium sp.]
MRRVYSLKWRQTIELLVSVGAQARLTEAPPNIRIAQCGGFDIRFGNAVSLVANVEARNRTAIEYLQSDFANGP